jgi:hypothetical protein
LLTIWGLIDPTSKARNLLHNIIKESKESSDSKDSSSEEDFLSNIINKVEQSVDKSKIDSNNPMSAIGNLMQSGVMTDLVNGMQKGLSDGSLNVGKLMSSVQTMIGKLGGSSKDGNNTGGGGGGGGMPDISQMMSMVGPLMSNFMSNNNDNSSLENKKNNNSADDEKKN